MYKNSLNIAGPFWPRDSSGYIDFLFTGNNSEHSEYLHNIDHRSSAPNWIPQQPIPTSEPNTIHHYYESYQPHRRVPNLSLPAPSSGPPLIPQPPIPTAWSVPTNWVTNPPPPLNSLSEPSSPPVTQCHPNYPKHTFTGKFISITHTGHHQTIFFDIDNLYYVRFR